jgi:hypothetical protein
MKKLLAILALAGLGYAVYKHFEYKRQLNAETWATGTDGFNY